MATYIEIDTQVKEGWFYIKTNALNPGATIYKELYVKKTDIEGARMCYDPAHEDYYIEVLCKVNVNFRITYNPANTRYMPIETFNGVAPISDYDLMDKIMANL